MRKLFSVLSSTLQGGVRWGLLFVALLATTTLWAYDFQHGDLCYNITNDIIAPYTVEVTNTINSLYAENYSGLTIATIPETVTYDGTTYSVTSIGYQAFYDCSSLTSVTIPNSVTSIGESAFEDCSSLATITIPNSVTSIGRLAFDGCSSLTSITIPNSVTSIGDYPFSGCSSLPIENNLRYADTYLVEAVDKTLSTYSIKEGTKWIGTSAFWGCSSLISITIPNSVTSIGSNAFSYCSSLPVEDNLRYADTYLVGAVLSISTYSIKEGTKWIGNNAFAGCIDLTSITIPESVTSIGRSAFNNCRSLTSIAIPNSITSIGDRAFCDCSALTSITIPNSVTSIGYEAFGWCESLTSITIPNSVTSIESGAFYGCSSLTSITIPNSVTSIGYEAFERCSSLTSITIPNSVTSIGAYAFCDCSSLTSMVVECGNTTYDSRDNCNAIIETTTHTLIAGCKNTIIPNSVISIESGAFYNCSSLASITIPNSVTSIGENAFYDCSSLTSIVVESGNATYDSRDNCNAIIETATNTLIAGCQNTVIPESVTSIGRCAFYGCSSLTSITIPNSVTSIGRYAFSSCSSLTSVTLGNSVTNIGDRAFSGCSSLATVTIGNSVTSIGTWAFEDCSSLTKTNYTGDIAGWCDIKFGGSNANPMYYSHNFYINDQEIKDLVIPNTVDSIHDYAFSGCSSLTSVTIGNSITSIGYEAFEGCSSLTSITCEATTPPTVGEYAFYDVSKSIPVYIPCGTISAYNTAQYWNEFTNFQEPLAEYSINVSTANNQMGTAKVDFNNCATAQISATANYHHYCFVQWSDGNTDNPRTLVLTQDTTFTAEFAQAYSGQCGDSLYWEYDSTNKTISITGSGDMYNYTANTQPWLLFKEEIAEVTISNTATSIGTSAFEGCIRLGKVSIGTATKNIAANAFAACTKLYDIYCLAAEPPTGYTSSFANYNAFLHVPCESQRLYMLDILFGEFKYIECIASDEVTTDDIVITPGSTDVTITWPTENNADTYTIVITKDGEVVCTLTFNADGQLLNIAFAPGRQGNHPAQYAEQAGNGYRFTVTNLESGTKYAYNIEVKDAANKTIKSHTGEFTTESLTAVYDVEVSENNNAQKIIRDNQLLILRDGKTYNVMGQEM